ncbi:MAG: hypothetical protein AAGF12_40515, partial [Myxococcota bacterium]
RTERVWIGAAAVLSLIAGVGGFVAAGAAGPDAPAGGPVGAPPASSEREAHSLEANGAPTGGAPEPSKIATVGAVAPLGQAESGEDAEGASDSPESLGSEPAESLSPRVRNARSATTSSRRGSRPPRAGMTGTAMTGTAMTATAMTATAMTATAMTGSTMNPRGRNARRGTPMSEDRRSSGDRSFSAAPLITDFDD